MPDVLDVQSLLSVAAKAAKAGDYPRAATLLRRALASQTSTHGPDHPDLSVTLNNLALMLEHTGQSIEAGDCYRRAYDIARAALPDTDPLVVTSRENLGAFIATRDHLMAFPSEHKEQRARVPAAPSRVTHRSPSVPQTPAGAPVATARAALRTSIAGIVAAIVIVAATMLWSARTSEPAASPAGTPADESADPPPAAAAASPLVAGGSAPSVAAPQPPAAVAGDEVPAPAPAGVAKPEAPAATAPVVTRVEDARLCTALTRLSRNWNCAAADETMPAGPVFYYTRVSVPRDTTVQHRWSRNGEVVHVIALTIRSGGAAGYRTFSRQTIAASKSGDWRVALIGPDGAVLDEQHIVVR
jgi:hypothetical protein